MINDSQMYLIGALLAISMGILAIGHYLWLKGQTKIDPKALERDLSLKERKESEDTKKAA